MSATHHHLSSCKIGYTSGRAVLFPAIQAHPEPEQGIFRQHGVIVQQKNIRLLGTCLYPLVTSPGKPPIYRILYQDNIRLPPQPLHASVFGAVVHYDDLPGAFRRCFPDTLNTSFCILQQVIGKDDYGHLFYGNFVLPFELV